MNNSINGDDSNIIIGQDNVINIHEKKKKYNLEPINERFRNYIIDFGVGLITVILTCISIIKSGFPFEFNIYTLLIPLAIGIFYLYYLPKYYPIMYIYVYEDRLIYLNKKEVSYSNIKEFKFKNNGLDFRLNRPKFTSLTLHNTENASFIFDAIKRYTIATDTLMPNTQG